jgi:tripartite-type tricarboxylate transporter receptor subunit TctC
MLGRRRGFLRRGVGRAGRAALGLAGGVLAALTWAWPAVAQSPPPPVALDGVVALLVAAPPGGSLDRIAGLLRPLLARSTSKSIDVRHDATPMVGEALAAASDPHAGEIRLVVATNSSVIAGRLLGVGAAPKPLREIDWLGVVARMPGALVVRAEDGAASLETWIDAARNAARPLRFGAAPQGSMSELAARLFAQKTGVALVHAPFSDMDAPYQALRRGDIDLLVDGLPHVLEEMARGGMRILLVTSGERSPSLPGTPAFGELWVGEDFSDLVLLGVGATERPRVRSELRHAWEAVARTPEFRSSMVQAGAIVVGSDPARARDDLEAEYLRHARLLARFPPSR